MNILKSKLATQDVAGFKNWLKNNPITVVYELEEPIITELPNFNPRTFGDKTTILLNSGVVQCGADFEVTNSLGSDIDVIKSKLSSLDDGVQKVFQYGSSVKKNLADKLTSEGLNISANETFESMISKISLGKKWASGGAVTSASYIHFEYLDLTSTIDLRYTDIARLNFEPSIIIVYSYNSPFEDYSFYTKDFGNWDTPTVKVFGSSLTSSFTTSRNLKANDRVILDNGSYRIPVHDTAATNVIWIAFE